MTSWNIAGIKKLGLWALLAWLFTPAAGYCAAPSDVQFTAVSTDTVSLSWVLDAPSAESPLMVISTASDFSVAFSSETGGLGAQTTTYYGLTPNTTYFFKVKVSTEPDAAYSALVSAVTDPNPPGTPLIMGVYSSSLTISWADAGNNPGSLYLAQAAQDETFDVQRVSTLTVSGFGVFEGLALNTTYYIRARTVGFSGVETADTGFGSTITLSAQPLSPSYTAVYSSGVLLSWEPNGNLSGTRYYVQVSSDDFLTLNYSSFAAAPELSTYGLAPNTTYYFKTASLNSVGVLSPYAVFQSTLTRAGIPKPHAGTNFGAVTADSIEVQWLQNSNPSHTEYYLKVSSSADFQGTENGSMRDTWFTWAALTSVSGLNAGVTFYFEVKARDSLLRETDWFDLGAKKTLPGADTVPPSVIDLQGGDDHWRGAASGSYMVHFDDGFGGSGLSKFEVKLSTSPGLAGTPLTGWTEVATDINAQIYNTDWQIPLDAFQTITEGVTAYVSVRVYDAAPISNVTISTDIFYVKRDTTPPTITNGAVSPSGWLFADPGVFNVDFADARSGLAFIQYSASGLAGAADAAVIGWTDIDTLVSSSAYTANWSVAFSALAGGATNYISVRAIDAAGNTTTLADAFRIMKAAGSPGVALTSPSAAYISSASYLSGSATGGNDGIAVSFVEVWLKNLANGQYYNGAAGFTSAVPVWLRASGAEAWSLNVATFGFVNLSSYTAVARAKDSLARYSLNYATVTFTLDQDAPSVYLSSPAALSTVYALDVVSGTAADTGAGPSLAGVSVRRLVDGKWWDFTSRAWGSATVSSMTAVSGGNWVFLPDVFLRGNMLNGYDYFITAYAADAAAPANVSAFGLQGATFTFSDGIPPGQTTEVFASTDPEASLPGRLSVTWVFPGDDGNSGLLAAGEFAIQYSTFTGFSYSTASALVLITTAAVPPGSTQVYTISSDQQLAYSTTYYLRLWTEDDAGLWSAASPEFSGVTGESLPDEIAGHIRTSAGQGITGVLVEGLSNLGGLWTGYTVDDGSGSFRLTHLAAGIYRIQVTWTAEGLTSSVAKDKIPVGNADTDFTLSVTYSLASVSGTLPLSISGRRASSFSVAGASEVELYQAGRRIAVVRAGADGSFRIGNILPGDYELRAPGIAPIRVHLRSGENLVVRPSSEFILGESLYAYPNPARTRVTFRLQTEAASVKDEINVFDVTGRLVKKIRNDDPGWDRSNPYNIRWVAWNFSDSEPAPGVYIYKANIKSEATGKTIVRTGKFAVVR
ncbi:MAG: hypothetical protein A2218_01625 [Elusimicrobia bacterium RIFOXYA2_FULL_53_38]|nr:MAG: hypothetical protein A2218_01625 [Elusimicrobia bacterium RIFOXYA2_FULL_53_38]